MTAAVAHHRAPRRRISLGQTGFGVLALALAVAVDVALSLAAVLA